MELGDVAGWVSAIAAIFALLWSWRAERRSRDAAAEAGRATADLQQMQSRLVAIEEAREHDRLVAGQSADLQARFVQGTGFNKLQVRNVGSAAAQDIAITIDGAQVGGPGGAYAGDTPPARLEPGASWKCEIFTSAMSSDQLHITMTWRSPSGMAGHFDSSLSLE